jgi:hypothetical protein
MSAGAGRLWSHSPLRKAPVRWAAFLILLALAAGIVWRAAYHPVDFGQYPAEVHSLLGGQRELYGPQSGLGWPMVYRCSPVFLFLFFPLALLPIHFAAAVWAVLQFVALYFVVWMVNRMARRTSETPENPGAWWLFVVLVCTSYLVQEIRGGNVQFFVFALSVAGFFFLDTNPAISGASFALGAAIKLLPVFFIPYLWVRGYRQVTLAFALFFAGLMLAPSLYFGFGWNLHLLKSWWTVGLAGSTSQWANNPDHSLLGVLNRYFSVIPYSTHFDPNYRNINFANFSPVVLRRIWQVIAASGYLGLLWLGFNLHRRDKAAESGMPVRNADLLAVAILFCAQLLLSPVTERIYLVALLFPAIVLAHELVRMPAGNPGRRPVFSFAMLALILFALPPLIPGRTSQRLLAVYSPDFWGMLSLLVCLSLLLRMQWRLGRLRDAASEG